MANEGAWPVDPNTQTGLFRQQMGDVNGTPHNPADGKADFEFISDEGIAALLLAYPTMPNAALSSAISSAAFQLIASAQEIQVDDIRIKTVERAKLMLEYATSLGAGVIASDAASAFNVVELNTMPPYNYRAPQGTPSPWPGMM